MITYVVGANVTYMVDILHLPVNDDRYHFQEAMARQLTRKLLPTRELPPMTLHVNTYAVVSTMYTGKIISNEPNVMFSE